MNYNDKKETFAVYGTLRLNQGNYLRILKNNSKFIKTTKIKGFEMFSLGGFPGITQNKEKEIVVDVFEVSCPETKRRLDMLEGYRSENDSGMYLRRKSTDVDGLESSLYIWNSKKTNQNINDGDWVRFIEQRIK
jgi:gamma-glutamylcyclotransferase (GGCT)/AIG2-like uncharacterized protein YtfP